MAIWKVLEVALCSGVEEERKTTEVERWLPSRSVSHSPCRPGPDSPGHPGPPAAPPLTQIPGGPGVSLGARGLFSALSGPASGSGRQAPGVTLPPVSPFSSAGWGRPGFEKAPK